MTQLDYTQKLSATYTKYNKNESTPHRPLAWHNAKSDIGDACGPLWVGGNG